MTADKPVERLRAALVARGITTHEPKANIAYPTLRLPQGLSVWCGPERFRWQDPTTRRWQWRSIAEPVQAAEELVACLKAASAVMAIC